MVIRDTDYDRVEEREAANGAPWALTILMIPVFFFIGWLSRGYLEPTNVTQVGVGAGPPTVTVSPVQPTGSFMSPTSSPTSAPTDTTGPTMTPAPSAPMGSTGVNTY